jgi:hypothetical protein
MAGGSCASNYVDHRDQHTKTLTLSAHDFITRVLWHAPPSHQHMIRHCGLYASAARAEHRRSRQLLDPMQAIMPLSPPSSATHRWEPPPPPTCPHCRGPLLPTQSLIPAHRNGEISNPMTGEHAPRLGPTRRSTGHFPAAEFCALRRRSLGRQMPVT